MSRIFIAMLLVSCFAFSQDVLITGAIVDDIGQPIAAAKVELEGTALYSMTDDSGYFKIKDEPVHAVLCKAPQPFHQPLFRKSMLCFSVFTENAAVAIKIYNLNGRLLQQKALGVLSAGNYTYPLTYIFGTGISNGFYVIKLFIGNSAYLFKAFYSKNRVMGTLFSSTGNNPVQSDPQARRKTSSIQSAGILKITKTGYFIQKMPISSLTANIGNVPVNRAQEGQEPAEFRLKIALDSLFTNPIFVSPAINDIQMADTASTDVKNIQAWKIDTSVITGLTPETRIWIKIDSLHYHPDDEALAFMSGFLAGASEISLVSDYGDIDTSDFSITASFTLNDFVPEEQGLKKRTAEPVSWCVVLLLSKYKSYRDDKAEAKLHTHINNWDYNISNSNAIIFVHGVNSSENIWLENGYRLMAKNMGYDVWTVNYPYSWKYHISSHGSALYERLVAETTPRRFSEYDSIYFVCHSMGGLVSRKALSSGTSTFLGTKTKAIILYASPSDGGRFSLKKTKWGRWVEFDGNKLSPFSTAGSLTGAMGFMDLMHGYMNEDDWKRIGIAYMKNRKSSCPLPAGVRPHATVVKNDEVVSEASAFDRNEPNDLKLKDPAVTYVKGNDYKAENAVLQPDGTGLLHSSSYESEAGKDLFRQWIPYDCPPTIVDADSNVYTTVKIGNQCWTVENLKSIKYNDGKPITHVPDSAAWYNLYATGSTTGAYCYYENNFANKDKYGVLYNWYAVNTGKLAPEGWRVPTDAEWDTLQNYLIANGYNWDGTTSGNKIAKSMAAQTDWTSYTVAGTIGNDLSKNNASGFSALPGGYRYKDGDFQSNLGFWWSATELDASYAWPRYLFYYLENLNRNLSTKGCGFSVRLLRG